MINPKNIRWLFILSAIALSGFVVAQSGELKQHLTFYDTFFGNEQDYQVCYPKDHKNFFYSIILSSATALFLLGFIIYYKSKNNKLLQSKNDVIQQKNQELLDSITYARRIQQALLPEPSVMTHLGVNCQVLYKPRDIVSGDFYWVYEDTEHIYAAVIDCTGHGVPGAFLSLLAHNAINKAVIELEIKTPAEVLHSMNDYVKAVLKQSQGQELKDGMEVGLCIIHKQTHRVEYAGAGIKLYYLSGQHFQEIKAAKCSVGSVQPHVVQIPENVMLQLAKGARLYMHSDGIVDQFGGENAKKFSTRQLKQFITDTGALSLEQQMARLEETFDLWKGPLEQTDDVLFLSIEL
ncbi:MAG: SpoIIE family protein phosphatase [Bacteroidetes bacterium]|nr:SpoIIE family protein phosphatase [Bacteroidota bacterium]